MYKVIFGNVEKKINKAIKGIKSKNGHTLYSADQLLKEVHEVVEGTTKLTIIINDLENDLDYSFDDIPINPNSTSPNLMDILEDDIIASGHEDAQKILNDLQRQYEDEAASGRQEKKYRTSKTNKKGFLGRLKKTKNEEENKEQFNEDVEDFSGFNEPEETESAVSDDFEEPKKELKDVSESEPLEEREKEEESPGMEGNENNVIEEEDSDYLEDSE